VYKAYLNFCGPKANHSVRAFSILQPRAQQILYLARQAWLYD